jgi:hypothetical protein
VPPKPEPKSEPLPTIEPSPAPDTPPVGAPIINASAPAPMLSLSMSDLESLMVRVMQAASGATEGGGRSRQADLARELARQRGRDTAVRRRGQAHGAPV